MKSIFLLGLLALATACASSNLGDERNEDIIMKRLERAYPAFEDAHVRVTSFEGIVLLTGQVPAANLIPLAEAEARKLRNVKRVYNELEVAGKPSFLSRASDGAVSTAVRTKLARDEVASARRIKVVTEGGVVYLLGLVTRAEGDAAAQAARTAHGAKKIVTVFDYRD